MDALLKLVQTVNGYLTDYILIFLLVGTGLFFTIKTKFVQVRCFGEGMRKVFGNIKLRGGKNDSGLSPFQALATAVAAQVGTGNIVGASGAILTGGPGAIFWMWVIAFFGMATIYAEATLAQETKVVKEDGSVLGGPVYYIKTAFKGGFGKFLAVFFAIAIILALGFMGSMVQSNSIAGVVEKVLDPEKANILFSVGSYDVTLTAVIVGAIIALVAAFIFLGGIQRIASVTEKLVPIMAILFLLGGVMVLSFNYRYILPTFGMIFKYAFTPQALIGGGIGAALKIAISQGAKRGLFSNEAGMGSTPHAHAQANVARPHDQGVVAMIGVFIDTFIVLTMTALVVISTLYNGNGPLAGLFGADYTAALDAGVVTKATAMQTAYTYALPAWFGNFGNIFVAICLLFFAFSTIISWNFFGKLNIQYLFGKKEKAGVVIYSVIAVIFIFLGSILQNDLVWELTDFFNYLMVLPNVIALIALARMVTVVKRTKKEKK